MICDKKTLEIDGQLLLRGRAFGISQTFGREGRAGMGSLFQNERAVTTRTVRIDLGVPVEADDLLVERPTDLTSFRATASCGTSGPVTTPA